jgi:hypothetical protein
MIKLLSISGHCAKSKSKSHCDWRSVSQSWCRAQSGSHDQIFITVWQFSSTYIIQYLMIIWPQFPSTNSVLPPSVANKQICLIKRFKIILRQYQTSLNMRKCDIKLQWIQTHLYLLGGQVNLMYLIAKKVKIFNWSQSILCDLGKTW